ncbi:hypothetical protein [Actinomadura rudentiformis]|uniref:Uncharacterized protein n=1 Tax=Actinomadura rudentiformis TaxID=359158 RepID=A0A6H9YN05_9ACTN|nr:hypothetical protein [Actinomadura rudentiformis]KAB2347382.1 hypothetical protein F8566_20430 [Actinomadura rudentiformis]
MRTSNGIYFGVAPDGAVLESFYADRDQSGWWTVCRPNTTQYRLFLPGADYGEAAKSVFGGTAFIPPDSAAPDSNLPEGREASP